ncbi:MAG: hypothetical protein RLZZ626_973 [Actinomycetota bacterium]
MSSRSRNRAIAASCVVAALTMAGLLASQSVQAQNPYQTQITSPADLRLAQATAARLIEASSMVADLDPSLVADQAQLDSSQFKDEMAARVRAVYSDSQFEENFDIALSAARLIHDEQTFKPYERVTMSIGEWHGATLNSADGTVTSTFRGALTFHFADHDFKEPSYDWSVVTTGLDTSTTKAKLVSYVAAEIRE